MLSDLLPAGSAAYSVKRHYHTPRGIGRYEPESVGTRANRSVREGTNPDAAEHGQRQIIFDDFATDDGNLRFTSTHADLGFTIQTVHLQ
jgi:hypothetical protein